MQKSANLKFFNLEWPTTINYQPPANSIPFPKEPPPPHTDIPVERSS